MLTDDEHERRAQQARSLELLGALSLARLWHAREEPVRARESSRIYDWFTEGFGSPDLVEARVLLDQLD